MNKIGPFKGDGSYGFSAWVIGPDVVVENVRATQWGDPTDNRDPGTTATGFSTAKNPHFAGVSLPMDIGDRLLRTKGSPLPFFKYAIDRHGKLVAGGTMVEVTNLENGKKAVFPLIDIGPAKPPHAHAAIDLTAGAFTKLGKNWKTGSMRVSYKIIRGAQFMPEKTTLVIHHTFSLWGDSAAINEWHKSRGWSGIGYHKVILNGFPTYKSWAEKKYSAKSDGLIQDGRKPETSTAAGVHPKDHPTRNRDGIHIALVGNFDVAPPGARQMDALIDASARLCIRHKIQTDNIFYHRDFADKSCPGKKFMSRAKFREAVKARIAQLSK